MSLEDQSARLQTLIQQAVQGDEAALGVLLENHRDWLRLVARKELQSQLNARIDASDLVQQTFLSACRRIVDFKGITTGEFAVWLKRIHERNIQDAIREHVDARKRSVRNEQSLDDNAATLAQEASTPSQHAERGEQRLELLQCLAELPKDQAEAVRLRHLEGWSLAQLAEHFGRSKDAAAALLKRGLESLRARIDRS